MRYGRIATLAGALALLPGTAAAQITLLEYERIQVGVGGYVQAFTGIHDRGFDWPTLPGLDPAPRVSGFHGQVLRVKWQAEGAGWRFDFHDRVQARINSAGGDPPALGLGVSAVPERLVDLETDLVDRPGLRLWHDVDRLSFTVHTPAVDLTAGRQAITWGTAVLFPVADLWTRFSPFEMETEEKPGIDALRALSYPLPRLELDAVLADRGSREDLSYGIRATYGHPSGDLWLGAGKFWRQAMAMGGVALLLDQAKLRAEVVVPYELDTGTVDEPRATAGFDWMDGTLALTGEYHFNGIGASDTGGYRDVLRDPRLARGETYHLGRHYLGAVVSWSPDEEPRLMLALNALGNLTDASLALTPALSYDLGQATRISLGALLSLGDPPRIAPPDLRLDSEFGAYGDLLFTRLAIYF